MEVDNDRRATEAVLADAGVQFAYLFGSRARGNARATSDADVAVMPGPPFDLLGRERLATDLAGVFGVPDIDVVSLDRAPLELRGRVVGDGRLLYSSDESARVRFEVSTRAAYFDFLPALREMQRGYLARVAREGPVMVDEARVQRLLETLGEYRERLVEFQEMSTADYKGTNAYAGRYLVQASAQVTIDIANHVIASSGWRPPRDFRDSFTVLEEHGILTPSLTERMRTLAGLRNRLVHVYEEVDDALVHAALQDGLDDLSHFARAVAALS